MITRVLLADDHVIFAEGLCSLLEKEPDLDVIGTVTDGGQAVRSARDQKPNVVVMDLSMPGMNGIEATSLIATEHPAVKVLCLSMHADRGFVMGALDAGASGYLLKDGAKDELLDAIRTVVRGQVYLSPAIAGTVVDVARSKSTVDDSLSLTGLVGADTTLEGDEAKLGAFDDRYELLEKLGSGSVGVVYKARDRMLQETVALKVLKAGHSSDSRHLERFRREILLGRDLEHPNILKVYDLGDFNGRKYLTMKLVTGPSLGQTIREESPLAIDRVITIARQLASALAAAREWGVVHRDIKPENIMIGEGGRPLLTDFGLARLRDNPGMTMVGSFTGTPAYTSPEQATLQPVSELSDLYSLGVTIFEMVAGRTPFVGDSLSELLKMHASAIPPRLEEIRPETPAGLCTIVRRCMEKDPESRYRSAEELGVALEALG